MAKKVKRLRAANKTEYITGTGQKLWRIHSEEKCAGRPCVIHNPSDHSMRNFPTHWRADRGIMERICLEHQVGHPDPDSPFEAGSYEWIHGCCGCCVGSFNNQEWIDHDAPNNGIGPICKDCHNLIDNHPVDHTISCQWR